MSTVKFSIIVVSDRVYEGRAKDLSGPLASKIIREHGFQVKNIAYSRNDVKMIRDLIAKESTSSDVILIIGGTGLGPKDVSVEAAKDIVKKEIPGFGELFRYLTFIREGTIAWLTRAYAALTIYNTLIFITPGSPRAVELALKEIILKEIDHRWHGKGV